MGEYDALPGLSQKPVPYKDPIEEGAPGHGCGHNIHGMTGVMGAIATKVIAGSAVDLITKPEILKKTKDEHTKTMKGRKYVCPIPEEIKPPFEIAREQASKQRTITK